MAPVLLALDRSMEWDVEKRKVGSRRRTHRRDGQNPARGCSVDAFAFRSRATPHKKRKERGGAKPEDKRATVAFKLSS